MIVTVGNALCTVSNATEEELAWLSDKLCYRDPQAHFTGGRTRKPLFDARHMRFPSGLLGAVERLAVKGGVSVQVHDPRVRPAEVCDDALTRLAWLHDHQQEAIEVFVTEPHGHGIVSSPTGSGKGDMIAGLVAILRCRWLVLVPSGDLMHQQAERILRRAQEKPGLYGDGVHTSGRVIVATFQSVVRLLAAGLRSARARAFFESFDGVIADEVHTVGADSYWRVMMALRNAYYRFGLSGTPLQRTDQRGALVLAATGDILLTIKAERLAALNLIAMPTVHLLNREVRPRRFSGWNEAYRALIADNEERTRALVRVVQQAPKPCIVFARELGHGKLIERGVRAAGIDVDYVHGKHTTAQREEYARRLAHRTVDVLVSSVVFRTGKDIPELRSVVLGAGGKSHIDALQSTGRGMRVRDRAGNIVKTTFPVYDLIDRGCGCSYVDALTGTRRYQHTVCKWMERHAAERRKAYRRAGYPMIEERV